MNSAAYRSPRFTCRVVRLWSSIRGAAPAAHCAACPECQAFFAAGDALENALRHAAPRAAATPMIGLDQRIARAVRESSPAGERVRPRRPVAAWAGIGVGAAAALAVALVLNRPGSLATEEPLPSSRQLADVVLGSVNDLSTRWETKVVPATQAVVAENPLQQELTSVVANGRNAVSFLATNFLPSRNG